MKKIIAILLIAFTALTLAGCQTNAPLEFLDAFAEGSNLNQDYSETYEYTVSLDTSYIEGEYSFVKNIPSTYGEYDYNGTYTEILTVLHNFSTIKNHSSDILYTGSQSNVEYVIKLYSKLELTATVNGQEHNDFIEKTVFLCPSKQSFAPVYSVTDNCSTLIDTSENQLSTVTNRVKTEILYSKTSYTTNVLDTGNGDSVIATTTTPYNYLSTIDNAELLFTIRNVNLPKTESTGSSCANAQTVNYLSIPVISTVYSSYKNIYVGYVNEVTANGFNTKCYSFAINDNVSSGRYHLIYVQNAPNENYFGGTNKRLMVKYVEPIVSLNLPFSCLGALVFTLTSAI